MRVKVIAYVILTAVLAVGAGFSIVHMNGIDDSHMKETDNGVIHDLVTLSGDERVLEGTEVGLNYLTSLDMYFESKIGFDSNGICLDETKETKAPDNGGHDEVLEILIGERTVDQKFEIWINDHYGEYTHGKRIDDKGYFFKMSEEEKKGEDTGYFPTYFFDESDLTTDYKANIEKQELPEGNGIYVIEYRPKQGAEYIVDPDMETTRFLLELGDDAVVRKMGFTEDNKRLVAFYTEKGMLWMKAIDLETEQVVSEMDIYAEKDAEDKIEIYFSEDLKAEGKGDFILVSCSKGFTLIYNDNGNYKKSIVRDFTDEDSFDTLGGYLDNAECRCRKVFYDGNSLIMATRIVKEDPIYPEQKGTLILVYDESGLKFSGVISSTIYRSDDEHLKDGFSVEYVRSDYVNGWMELYFDEYEPDSALLDEEGEMRDYLYGYYDIGYVRAS